MSPIDACPPAVIVETDMPDAAAEEMEWLAIESAAFRVGPVRQLGSETSYRVPQPDGFRYPKYPYRVGSAYWCGPKVSGPRIHPKGYRVKGESAGLPARAKSPIDAARQLDAFPSVTYTPPQLGPWDIYDSYGKGMNYKLRGYTYIPSRGVWR